MEPEEGRAAASHQLEFRDHTKHKLQNKLKLFSHPKFKHVHYVLYITSTEFLYQSHSLSDSFKSGMLLLSHVSVQVLQCSYTIPDKCHRPLNYTGVLFDYSLKPIPLKNHSSNTYFEFNKLNLLMFLASCYFGFFFTCFRVDGLIWKCN